MPWPEGGKRLPLWDAIYHGDTVAAQKLLVTPAGAAQVNTPHGLWQQTCVHVAVLRGHIKLLKHLLFTGADVNARTINGTTPLHLAVEMNRRDIVQDLLLAGANPLLRNFTGQTPLQLAVSHGLKPIAMLLRQGVDSQQTLASLEAAAHPTAKRQLLRTASKP
ncbi:2-5A-dependent ribonuclease-like [Phytophthora cinnamomi]|uniref:2-5A-dependent ribonuclease-like n=1 Tax=Phytophthora cinnamomi TaxID=4785 RepID=UPI00355AB8A6|nr:2-5A-dependent ribonuclease-like [Phytophthora cinnamomi]